MAAQTRAFQIKFTDSYGYSGFPFPRKTREVERLMLESQPTFFWITHREGGKLFIHWNEDRPTEDHIFSRGVFRRGFTGEPLPETLEFINGSHIPCLEVSDDGGARVYYPLIYKHAEPYVGRIYEVFKADCYTLVREYLADKKGWPLLPVADLKEAFRRAQIMGRDFLASSFFEYGYEEVTKAQPNDIIIIGHPGVPVHCAVLLESGDILHHYPGRVSCIEPYDGVWLKDTMGIVRYRGNQ